MQAITGTKVEAVLPSAAGAAERPCADWITLYSRCPTSNATLFDLEAMVAKRMELLAWIAERLDAPVQQGFDAVTDEICARLPQERRASRADGSRMRGTTLGVADADEGSAAAARRSGSRGVSQSGTASAPVVVFETADEDLISHMLCRYAFCMSERWRKWFVRTEEALLRARIKMEIDKNPVHFLVDLLKRNNLPCSPLTRSDTEDPRFQEYLAYRASRPGGLKDAETNASHYYSIPLSLATRLIRSRQVLCRGGRAILFRDQVQEVFMTVFKARLNKGLHEAFMARARQQGLEDETELDTVTHMLDVFLEQFVADPADVLEGGAAGSVRAGDVAGLAQRHFPLCMRQIDSHLRREGHLKHHGRFMYGLFLRAIGLTLEDSLALFSSLMTVKGGGSVEAFSKLSYGYNVRHNYGMEGKKVAYSSESCGTILGLPPAVDKNDCHGCPFRFKDETAFRTLLQREQLNPLGSGFPNVRLAGSDIEDIIQDCKGQHYTRACYKYFMGTHKNVKRDTLFRAPIEYYRVSRESEVASSAAAAVTKPSDEGEGRKRSSETQTDLLKEDAIRERKES